MPCKFFNTYLKKILHYKMRKYLFILLLTSTSFGLLHAQNSNALELITQYGYVIPANNFLNGTNTGKPVDRLKSMAARYIIHTDGSKDWHQLYNYIDYGFGAYFASFNEPKHLGNAMAIYAFIYSPIARWGRFSLKNDLVLGLSYVQKHWSLDNVENIAVGSHLNCYIQEGFLLDYKISNHFQLGLGVNVSHISNGATKRPNKGINSVSTQLYLRYNFYNSEEYYTQDKPKFKKGYDFVLSAFGGFYNDYAEMHQYSLSDARRYHNRTFYAYGLTTTAYKRLGFKNNLGLGFNWGYDDLADNYFKTENNELISTIAPFSHRLNLTCFISYEYKINHFSAFAEIGYYLIRQTSKQSNPNLFQRVGFRYNVIDNLFLTSAIRASNFSVAHYIEWGIGYRFNLLSPN